MGDVRQVCCSVLILNLRDLSGEDWVTEDIGNPTGKVTSSPGVRRASLSCDRTCVTNSCSVRVSHPSASHDA